MNNVKRRSYSKAAVTESELELQTVATSISDDDDDTVGNRNRDSLRDDGILCLVPDGMSFCDGDDDDDDDDKSLIERELQLYRLSNLGVPLNYLFVGLVQGLVYPLINVYPLDLGATEAQQTTLLTLNGLPACFKIFFGFWSDNMPIGGLRRKPYMLFGWALAVASLLPVLLLSDLSLVPLSGDSNNRQQRLAPSGAPTMPLLCSCFFLSSCGVWITDVMADSLVAEKAKLEMDKDRGNTQAICYAVRGLGFAITSPLSTWLYNGDRGPHVIILMALLLPLCFFPAWYHLREHKVILPMSTREQCFELWNTVCSRAVWQPMGFIFLYCAMFVSNSAWKQFLETVLGFTSNQLNALMIIAGVLAFAGVVSYKLFLTSWSWRRLYLFGMALNGAFSALQLLLIKGETFGLDPFFFALGDDAMMDFILGTQLLPMCVMMVNLVPTGVEGASYALYTTTSNVAGALSDSLSTMLLRIWDVSKEALIQGDLTGLTKLTILTTVLQTFPILFIGLLPHSVEDIERMRDNKSYSSSLGGTIFLLVVAFSILWAVFVGFMNILHPGWMGES
mmetsp:Transcript_27303/g.48473  ORF Transcript_27303/g.48473 Transcript_27303/m.48473 type:complete len:563 (+) Transcript_27303:39-1727(+)